MVRVSVAGDATPNGARTTGGRQTGAWRTNGVAGVACKVDASRPRSAGRLPNGTVRRDEPRDPAATLARRRGRRCVCVTPHRMSAGRRLVAELDAVVAAFARDTLGTVGARDPRTLIALLDPARDGVHDGRRLTVHRSAHSRSTGPCALMFGGLVPTLGLFTRPAALLIASTMLGRIAVVHRPGGCCLPNGVEYAPTLRAAALAVAVAGPGAFSLDAGRGGRRARA